MLLKVKSLIALSIIAVIATLVIDPVPQWPGYHQFADQRMYFGITSFFNVTSNLFYLALGAHCLYSLTRQQRHFILPSRVITAALFFGGLILTGVGSSLYHLNTTNDTLLWDRLPMTISFMSFFAFVIMVCISQKWGQRLLVPLLIAGVLSVVYWHYTERIGQGDLRFYALVQFLPMVLIPIILLLFKGRFPQQRYLWWVVGIYAVAKTVELYDAQIMNSLSISGHTLKHIISAFTAYALLKAVMAPIDRSNSWNN